MILPTETYGAWLDTALKGDDAKALLLGSQIDSNRAKNAFADMGPTYTVRPCNDKRVARPGTRLSARHLGQEWRCSCRGFSLTSLKTASSPWITKVTTSRTNDRLTERPS